MNGKLKEIAVSFLPRASLSYVAVIHDLVMAALSFLLSLRLRYGDELLTVWSPDTLAAATALFTAIAAVVFLSLRMYRGIWRYASTNDLTIIARAVTLVVVLYLPALFLVTRLQFLPRSFLVINWFVLMALLGGPRFLYRMIKDRGYGFGGGNSSGDGRRIPVLLVGEGDDADQFIRACQRGVAQYQPVGILSQNPASTGRELRGVPILGILDEIDRAAAALKAKGQAPERLVLTEHSLQGAPLRHLVDEASALGIAMARLPRPTELKSESGGRVEIAPVAVEDLLGRPQTVLDREAMRALIRGRRVLVTGAGGSIGSELTRQIAAYEPSLLCLVDASEFALYTIDMEISERHPDLARAAIIADVRDRNRIGDIFAQQKPELLFHAAALKHVPLVEANPVEGLLTNAVGTRIVADAARAQGVALMVLISTDKAVNPSSVMGAAKRAAETYCQALDTAPEAGTRFVTVRFGNVLGSTGSVVPLFQRQLAAGGPLTVTDPEVTRYFMTVREAVELVLQASALGMEHESYRGRLFVLDMGEPVRILDIARQMIRLAGLRPEIDIAISFTGLRPGEKLFEEIFHTEEPAQPTEREGILLAAVRAEAGDIVASSLDRLEAACRSLDRNAAMAALRLLVPEYSPPGAAK